MRIQRFRFLSVLACISGFAGALPAAADSIVPDFILSGEIDAADGAIQALLAQASPFIHADTARTTYSVNGSGFSAAIIDTGINYLHSGLASHYLGGYDFVSNDSDPYYGGGSASLHGTNVAGIVAGSFSSGGTAYTGIAPGAGIVSLRALDNSGSGSSTAVNQSLQWVIDNHGTYNISVINMSLGDGGDYTGMSGFDTTRGLIDQLYNLKIPVVVSAGNSFYSKGSAQGMSYPAIIPETISVGAVWDQSGLSVTWSDGARDTNTVAGSVVSFSQRLSSAVGVVFSTDIFAPGALITSAGSGTAGTVTMGGTSQAAPMAKGAILLAQDLFFERFNVLPSVSDLLNWMKLGGVSFVDANDGNVHDNVANTGAAYTRLDVLGMLGEVPNSIPSPATLWLLFAGALPMWRSGRKRATAESRGEQGAA